MGGVGVVVVVMVVAVEDAGSLRGGDEDSAEIGGRTEVGPKAER